MKNCNTTPQHVLLTNLQNLYYAEKIVKSNFDQGYFRFRIVNDLSQIKPYLTSTDDTIRKLEKIFSYMLQEPQLRKNQIVYEFIKEYKVLVSITTDAHLQDVLLLNLLQNIAHYKIVNYKTAYLLSVVMQLDTVSDLIQQILEEQHGFKNKIEEIAITEFNQVPENIE